MVIASGRPMGAGRTRIAWHLLPPVARTSGKTGFLPPIPRICFVSTAKGSMIDPEGGICLKPVPLSGMIRPVLRKTDAGELRLAELIRSGGQQLGEQG